MDMPVTKLLRSVRPANAAGPQAPPCAKGPPRRHARSPRCELLEPRTLLSLIAVDTQFQVNQSTSANPRAPVAVDANGNFVVVWGTPLPFPTGPSYGIYGRRCNAAGEALGDEFRIATGALENEPRVAMDPDGDFVVAWLRHGSTTTASSSLYARVYDAAGAPRGNEFAVTTHLDPQDPSIAMDADGDFVVAWDVRVPSPSFIAVYGRRYDATGIAQGGEFVIEKGDESYSPSVAMDAGGDFVVAWSNIARGGIYARRYNPAGVAQGDAFQVSATGSGDGPHVAMDDHGDFVVSIGAIYARRFGADGTALGAEFPISPSRDAEGGGTVAMDADGDFVVTWASHDFDIFASEFRSDGVLLDADVLVGRLGVEPAVDMTDAGTVVVSWSAVGGLEGRPVYARQLTRQAGAAVVGRQVFYNHSVYDDGSAAASSADDKAIVSYRHALRPGQEPSRENVTSYSRGINGIMVDVAGLPPAADPSDDRLPAGDFQFLVGDGTFAGWGEAPPPVAITVRRGAGFGGSDRVTLIWEDGAVRDEWLKVTVLANESTGLAAADAFSFGNLAGEVFDTSPGTDLVLTVTATDLVYLRHWLLRFKQKPAANILNRFDFNRDGRFDSRDAMIVRSNLLHSLATIDPITAPAPALLAPPAIMRVWDDRQRGLL